MSLKDIKLLTETNNQLELGVSKIELAVSQEYYNNIQKEIYSITSNQVQYKLDYYYSRGIKITLNGIVICIKPK